MAAKNGQLPSQQLGNDIVSYGMCNTNGYTAVVDGDVKITGLFLGKCYANSFQKGCLSATEIDIDDEGVDDDIHDVDDKPVNLFRLRQEVVTLATNDDANSEHGHGDEIRAIEEQTSLRLIPTLAELCLQQVTKDEVRYQQRAPLPPGLWLLVKEFRHQRWLQQVRFEWLLKALVQAERVSSDYLSPQERCLLFVRDTLNVDSYMGTRYAPELSMLALPGLVPSMLALPEPVDGYDASDWCIAVLAHTVNMLLPTTATEPTASCAPDENRDTMAAFVRQVKCCLSSWAPKLVHSCFSVALAHVWWSRGYTSKAVELLLRHIALNLPRSQTPYLGESTFRDISLQRALILNEIGRLMTFSGQPEVAGNFYRDSVECSQHECPQDLNTRTLYSLVLCASAFDQGVMDQPHADRARSQWDTVLCEPNCPQEIMQGALVSLLHCHTGRTGVRSQYHLQVEDANRQWLLEIESRLQEPSQNTPSVYFYLSVIRALLGREEDALEAYRLFVTSFIPTETAEVPGLVACSDSERRKSYPWWVFSRWISGKTGHSPKVQRSPALMCLPLLWRRVFGYPGCIVGCRGATGCPSEVSGASLDLHITRDGFLTGCFMENLPPIASFLLDPHTGRACVPNQNRHIELQKWDNFHTKQEGTQPTLRSVLSDAEPPSDVTSQFALDPSYSCGFRVDTGIPTPIILLTNRRTGSVCRLLISNNIVNYKQYTNKQEDWEFSERCPEISHHMAVLILSNGSQDLKVDLRSVILRARRDDILKELGSNAEFIRNPNRMKEAQTLLQTIIRHKRQIPPSLIADILDEKRGPLKRAIQSDDKELIRRYLPPPQTIRVSNILYVGESTVILSLMCAHHPYSSQSDNVLVFVDCRSEAAFNKPVVHFTETSHSFWELPVQVESWKTPDANIGVFFAYESILSRRHSTENTKLVVFDEFGAVLYKCDGSGYQAHQKFVDCSGWQVLGIDETTTQVVSFDARTRECRWSDALLTIESLRVAEGVVFVGFSSGVIALDSINLKPLEVHGAHTTLHGLVVEGEHRFLRILASRKTRDDSVLSGKCPGGRCSTRVFLGLANHVLILQITREKSVPTSLIVTADVTIPGIPTELCYVSQSVGFVVTATVSMQRQPTETEMLYWFDMSGAVRGVHPMLGSGPHGIIAVPFKSSEVNSKSAATLDDVSQERPSNWYLYFADGFGGICCMRLS